MISMNKENILIKGIRPEKYYNINLVDVFFEHVDRIHSIDYCAALLSRTNIRYDREKLIASLFPYFRKKLEVPYTLTQPLPFTMGEVLKTQFIYNLEYQDTVIKIEYERYLKNYCENADEKILYDLLEFIVAVLYIELSGDEPIYLGLTNLELDYIVLKCTRLFLYKDMQHGLNSKLLQDIGIKANDLSFNVLMKVNNKIGLDMDNIVPFLVYSGIIWWSEASVQQNYIRDKEGTVCALADEIINHSKNKIKVNQFEKFKHELLDTNQQVRLVYIFDDNGELVWDLFFIKVLLGIKDNISITCLVNNIEVTNNSNSYTLKWILKNAFYELSVNERFSYFEYACELATIDLRFVSGDMIDMFFNCDAILVKGASYYEKIQYLPVPVYYAFTVYNKLSSILTGLNKCDGVFLRGVENSCCYSIEGKL